ncbi:MAG: AsmA-like C-terminal region-containing protein, partial [Verrucomicrobia bacterium]|nr:AsmA-like C-terminal region-containing protein [Verrucomicrobiota bacterium]
AKLPGIRTAGIEASQVHFVADARTDSLEGGVIDIDYSVDFGALSHGWVSVTNGSSAGALSLSNGESVHLKRFTLSADAAEADDVQFENVGVKGAGEAPDLTGVLTNCIVEFDADTVTGGGFKFKDVESVVEVDSWDIREDALKGRVHSSVGEVHSEYGLAGNVRLNSDFSSNGAVAPELLKKLGPWRYLVSYRLGIGLSVEEIESPRFHAGGLEFDAGWNPPVLDIRNLALNLYGGRFEGAGDIDVATRRVTGKFYTDFDPHGLDPILPERAYRLLSQYGWKKPPKVWAEAGLTLPPWSEWGGNWSNAVKPTVEMSGRFEIEDGSFRGIPATGAESHFYFTNLTWYLPDLIVRRPEGEVRLEYTCYTPTKDFRWNVKSSVIPTAVRPALESQKHKEAVDDFDFREPPSISGVVWGRWHSRELLGFEGGINASNFVYRGEDVESLRAHAAFTNGWIKGTDIELERAEGRITGDGVGCDIPRRIVCFTNIVSTVDPMAVARAIGPKSAKAIEPYEFKEPPMVEVNGVLPVKERKETRMRFDVSGDEFSFWKFRIPEVSSVLYWHTNHLVFEGVEASFYDGRLNGAADFDLSPSEGAVFNFDASVTNVNTHSMVSDLFGSGQTLEGDLSGRLIVTSAHTKDNGSWNGYGKVSLEDGLIWDVPVFGIVSSVLNAFIPGLGNSRADQANAFFTIDNSVIHTDELEICAPGLRLLYRGDVDFDGNIDGVAEAVFLRDVWGVGLAMRIVLKPLTKLFEYKIEGTLSEPVYEPVYLLPKLIILPLRPFSTMKDYLIPSESEPAR